jgi:hypothetical protein
MRCLPMRQERLQGQCQYLTWFLDSLHKMQQLHVLVGSSLCKESWHCDHLLVGCSHLQGMFNRTIRVLEAGMKPVYVPLCEQLLYPVPTCNDNDTRGGICFVCYIFCLYLFKGEACVRLKTCQILVCVCLFQICVWWQTSRPEERRACKTVISLGNELIVSENARVNAYFFPHSLPPSTEIIVQCKLSV